MRNKIQKEQILFRNVMELFFQGSLMNKNCKKIFNFNRGIDLSYAKKSLLILYSKINNPIISLADIKTEFDLCILLCDVYNKLFNNNTVINSKIKIDVEIQKYAQNNQIIKKLIKYLNNNEIKKNIHSVGLLGSYASNDYIDNISDIDSYVIIKNDAFKNPNDLLDLKDAFYESTYYFYKADPHQHHGYFVFTEYDLNNYSESFLPLSVLRNSLSLIGNCQISVRIEESHINANSSLTNTIDYLEKHSILNFKRIYDFKFYFQVVQLLPIVLLQNDNIYYGKKESFELFEKKYNIETDVFDLCFYIRNNWKLNSVKPGYIFDFFFKITKNPKHIYYFNELFFRKIPNELTEFIKHRLTDEKIKKLLSDIKKEI